MKYLLCIFMVIYSSTSYSESQMSKDWAWEFGESVSYAATVNDTSRVLGQYCTYNEGDCFYQVTLGGPCEIGSEYPSIINSKHGASSVTLICRSLTDDNDGIFMVSPFDEIDELVRRSDTIGFAIPVEGNSFKVIRFSLSGSTYAIEMMRAGTELLVDPEEAKQTKIKDEEYL